MLIVRRGVHLLCYIVLVVTNTDFTLKNLLRARSQVKLGKMGTMKGFNTELTMPLFFRTSDKAGELLELKSEPFSPS